MMAPEDLLPYSIGIETSDFFKKVLLAYVK